MLSDWGLCDIDQKNCFGAGAICKQNKKDGFVQTHKGQGKKEPFRNKDCSHFKKTSTTLSEYEKALGRK